MPLPTSGPLSLANIQAQFGGINPISLSEYYAGAGLVPNGTSGINGPIPSSGPISVSMFYGAPVAPSVVIRLTNTSKTVDSINSMVGDSQTGITATAGIALAPGGQLNAFANQYGANWFAITPNDEWMTPNGSNASLYEARATSAPPGLSSSGASPTSWVNLSGGNYFSISATRFGVGITVADTGLFDIQIRRVSDGVVLASCTARLTATAEVMNLA